MALSQRNFKLTDDDLNLLEELADDWKTTQTEVLRRSLRFAWTHHRLVREDTEKFIARLRDELGEDATITIRLDDTWSPVVTVDGRPAPNIYAPVLATKFDDEDFFWAYLGDPSPDSRARVRVALLPAQAGVAAHVSVNDLAVDMRPRPVAYFPKQ
jgi:hypothetical protein